MIRLFNCAVPSYYRDGIDTIFNDGNLASGHFVKELEIALGQIYQMDCVAFSNMTTALLQLFKSLNLTAGDTVLCHPFCCLSTSMAIKLAGLNVEWIQFDQSTLCLDIKSLQKRISDAKVLLNYNVSGFLPDLRLVAQLCKENNVIFINDCNNSELSKSREKFSVQYGDYSVTSFYPNRTFGAIDGAAILSSKSALGVLRKYQRLGISKEDYRQSNGLFNPKHDVNVVAGCNNMSNISAKLILNRLKFFNKIMTEKRKTFEVIADVLKEVTIRPDGINETVPWAMPIFVNDCTAFHEKMFNIGIETTELHFDNSQYSLFSGNGDVLAPSNLMWAPFDAQILQYSEEIIYYAKK